MAVRLGKKANSGKQKTRRHKLSASLKRDYYCLYLYPHDASGWSMRCRLWLKSLPPAQVHSELQILPADRAIQHLLQQ